MAGTVEQLNLLKENIAARTKGINSRRLYYRKMAFYVFISTAVLAGMTTIILSLRPDPVWVERIRVAAVLITTAIAVLNTYNAFVNHKDLWVANNNALNKFYELNFDIEFFEKDNPPLDMSIVEKFKARYQAILDELNQVWSKSRAEGSSQKE